MKTATLRDYKRRILRVLVQIQQHLLTDIYAPLKPGFGRERPQAATTKQKPKTRI